MPLSSPPLTLLRPCHLLLNLTVPLSIPSSPNCAFVIPSLTLLCPCHPLLNLIVSLSSPLHVMMLTLSYCFIYLYRLRKRRNIFLSFSKTFSIPSLDDSEFFLVQSKLTDQVSRKKLMIKGNSRYFRNGFWTTVAVHLCKYTLCI